MRVIAVIPAFNEESRIKNTLQGVKNYVDDVIVVDDGSIDQTAITAENFGAVVIRHALNRGQGAGLKTGTEAALRLGADLIVHVDADGQHDPEFIPGLLAPIKEDKAQIVFGSRFMGQAPQNMPVLRRALLNLARLFNAFAMGIPRTVTDPQSGLRAMSREAAIKIDFKQDRMAHCSEILRLATRSGLPWVEVPVRVVYTEESLAKGQKSLDAAKIAWQLFLGIFTR
ncbi:MAG: glycosyltransferase family 2 protein [Patescibacteria group bacterium]